jgi:penicillin-binding protein 1A
MDTLRQLEELYGRELLLQGNLRIYTTLHSGMQRVAEQALERGIRAFEAQGVNQGAIVLIDLRTGGIRAMVGWATLQRVAVQRHHAGATPARLRLQAHRLRRRLRTGQANPEQHPAGCPNEPALRCARQTVATPRTPTDAFGGRVTVTRALAASINVPAVRAAMMLGADTIAQFARERLGFESPLNPTLPIALGASARQAHRDGRSLHGVRHPAATASARF